MANAEASINELGTPLKSIGTRLLLAVIIPAFVMALLSTAASWRQIDAAVREKARIDALGLVEFLATSFNTTSDAYSKSSPRVVHRAVTHAVRSDWLAMKLVTELRIIGNDGIVLWSRNIEEEDRAFADASRLQTPGTNFDTPSPWWSSARNGGGEVTYPLGGSECGSCHLREETMNIGMLQLTVGESVLRRQVANVFLRTLLAALLFITILATVVYFSMRSLVTRRIAKLSDAMQRAEEGNLLVRAPDFGNDELGQLAQTYNHMLARIIDLKVTEIDTQRDLDHARTELSLKTELETLFGELQILYDLARTITSTLDLNEILERITNIVPTKLKVSKFSIMLLNKACTLTVLKAWPKKRGSDELTFAVGEGICGRAAELREAIYAPDVAQNSFYVRDDANAQADGSLLSIPMVHGDKLLGVLNFERPEKASFTAEEIEFFTAVTGQVAMGVQNVRMHEQTITLSVTDPLTNIPNRRYLLQQLDAEIARANRFGTQLSLLMIDIDHFKHVNDVAGHSAGDNLLREVSAILSTSVRKVDVVARYGGEEFVVLLPQIPREEALTVAEKLRQGVETIITEKPNDCKVTISVGIANLPCDATLQGELINCADAALYAAKRAGRNQVKSYQPGMALDPDKQPNSLE